MHNACTPVLVFAVALAACNGSNASDASDAAVDAFYAYDITTDLPPPGDGEAPYDASLTATAQDPPTSSGTDVEAWLATGMYLSWHCEPAPHPARSPSPHSTNRICTNDVLSGFTGTGEYPVGSAAVKEIYGTGTTIIGYAVYRHVRAGATGSDWWWYERLPLDSAAPHDDAGVVAAGPGTDGPARAICVACHSAAGSDAMHSGHDFVYTQVTP